MFRTNLDVPPFKLFDFEKIKAFLLCILIVLASTPRLHASSQCDTPYETNCVVTGCGFPGGCTYTLTLNDNTPGATIHYIVSESGEGEITWGTLTSGQSFTVSQSCTETEYGCYAAGSLYGTMYATAPGYTESSSISLSF